MSPTRKTCCLSNKTQNIPFDLIVITINIVLFIYIYSCEKILTTKLCFFNEIQNTIFYLSLIIMDIILIYNSVYKKILIKVAYFTLFVFIMLNIKAINIYISS